MEKEIFYEALEITDPEERELWLRRRVDGDDKLFDRVFNLLALDDNATEFMDKADFGPMVQSSDSGSLQWKPPEAEMLDEWFEPYRIESLLGHGGMGAVYRGIQISLDRPVAIKILPPELGNSPDFAERFRREAHAMAKLSHNNIVGIHDFGSIETEAGWLYYIVMEFVKGRDLHQLIRTGQIESLEAVRIVRQICDALEFAHGEGYLHRDIKPANIFVTESGLVKVGDFGLAKLTGTEDTSIPNLTQSGHTVGTPLYMAPESLKGESDQRADIYSLGVMFYELLTGDLPQGVFPSPSEKSGIDKRIDEVVFKAMQSDPGLRYQEVSEIRKDIGSIFLPDDLPAIQPQPVIPRSRLLIWIAIPLVIALIGAFFFQIKRSDRNLPGNSSTPRGSTSSVLDHWRWEPPQLMDSINDSKYETSPDLSADGLTLVFNSSNRILLTHRKTPESPWQKPAVLDLLVKGADGGDRNVSSPCIAKESGRLIFLCKLGENNQFFESVAQADGSFSSPVRLGKNLNDFAQDSNYPDLSEDGLTLTFIATRTDGMGSSDIYITERKTLESAFAAPALVSAISSMHFDTFPRLSDNGKTLLAIRYIPDGKAMVWSARRERGGQPFTGAKPIGEFFTDRYSVRGFTVSSDYQTIIWSQGSFKDRNLDLWTARSKVD